MISPNNILSLLNLSVGYTSKKEVKTILSNIDLNLQQGQLTSLLGANGSGKSTLIRTIAGVQSPLAGSILISGKELRKLTANEVARQMSLVLAQAGGIGNLTVYALVSLGRFPYTSWMGGLKNDDKQIIFEALESVGILNLANEHIDELSDGQKQKVMIARALAQDTDIILLDEPTAHLDFPNKLEVMHLLRKLAQENGKTILISSHDLDSALTLSDQLWLIDRNRQVHSGVPEDLVLQGLLEKSFLQEDLMFDYEQGQFRKQLGDSNSKISLEGPQSITRWLRAALERNGYQIVEKAASERHILAVEELPNYSFRIDNSEESFNSIHKLLTQLKHD